MLIGITLSKLSDSICQGLYIVSSVSITFVLFLQGGRLLIRLGDSDIDYDKNFK